MANVVFSTFPADGLALLDAWTCAAASILLPCSVQNFEMIRQLQWMLWTTDISKISSYFDGLVQERRNSIANALELRLSYTNPSIWILSICLHNDSSFLFNLSWYLLHCVIRQINLEVVLVRLVA